MRLYEGEYAPMVTGMLAMMFSQLDQPQETWEEVLRETDAETRGMLKRVLGVMGSALASVEAEEA